MAKQLPQNFDKYGLLPAGDYELTIEQIRRSLLVRGPAVKSDTWDMEWRSHLVDNLEILVKQLWKVGIENIFINGSFVEDKDHPNDIDGYFECDLKEFASGRLAQRLNMMDPHKIWTWDPSSRRPHQDSDKKQLPMWHEYRVELYPHYDQLCSIPDRFGNLQMFPSAFRQSRREYRSKGIVRIIER
ncbi:MAG: hypothetical protein HY922_01255 [Elusimicrobia bacterium]|nr:hypothetical protein [Elusimicrobiota bacterium]